MELNVKPPVVDPPLEVRLGSLRPGSVIWTEAQGVCLVCKSAVHTIRVVNLVSGEVSELPLERPVVPIDAEANYDETPILAWKRASWNTWSPCPGE